MARTWIEELDAKLKQKFGATKGSALSKKYSCAFPRSYQDEFTPNTGISDIELIETLSAENSLEINIYDQNKNNQNRLYIKLYQFEKPISLSDILPMLENMDLRIFSERPYKVLLDNNDKVWISDFSVDYMETTTNPIKIKKIKKIFCEALIKINSGICENDGFNRLILDAELPWREVTILRMYAKYLQQINFRYSQSYMEKTVSKHHEIAKLLVSYFKTRFDPEKKLNREKNIASIENKILKSLDGVTNLDEDYILRSMYLIIKATLRTNYFLTSKDGSYKDYLAIKKASADIPDLPLPRPLFAIYVYSRRFEAIHLRAEKVARGGIRWSDREDYRTEVLGLMKAQKVKNAIIVPSGAKGGFILKEKSPQFTREMLQAEVLHCYKSFMRGLLDLTDNIVDGKVVSPPDVVCHDENDPYLVVAADKGTASFSDVANSIAKEYNFWLGDAFASGGSNGYDHKKIGITARGAWESIKRHFRSISINSEKQPFTVVGIGDMSGDVFGNGMLQSQHIKLIAAFDHRDIFLDPNPDTKKSYKERLRLFNEPASSWADYNSKLISKGGGVYSRSSKSISISSEVRKALDIEATALTPNELIQAILKAPVDLLYNGGIGTYVKASTETSATVGDKTNEFTRVNGKDLRCRVVGEGGNLGFTQLGRIEYALKGGLINTDFIDNSAGVDCSDHEVNIKILLDRQVAAGKLTETKRNELLFSMKDEVAKLVLQDNYNQALALAFSTNHSPKLVGLYQVFLNDLELAGVVDRTVEFLPDDKTIMERKAEGKGLTSPELAILLAYSKIHIKNEILKSKVPDDDFFYPIINTAFPEKLCHLYKKELATHPLRREIIATQLSNLIVNEMGITFVYRIQNETGALVSQIMRAYIVASKIFGISELQRMIDTLGPNSPVQLQYELLHHIRTLANIATRWFLHNERLNGDLQKVITHYSKRVAMLEGMLPELMVGVTKDYMDSIIEKFTNEGLSPEIGRRLATTRAIYTALNIIEVSTDHHFDLIKTAKIYFEVGSEFHLVWFRDQIANDVREGHWITLAKLTLRDELDSLQKLLTIAIMKSNKREDNANILIKNWAEKNSRSIERWEKMLELLYSAPEIDYASFFIVTREFLNVVNSPR